MNALRAILTTTVPVPLWFALLMVGLLCGMNYLVREQLRLVKWFYEQRPSSHPAPAPETEQ